MVPQGIIALARSARFRLAAFTGSDERTYTSDLTGNFPFVIELGIENEPGLSYDYQNVYRNGELIGAVGGSGGTAQEDEDASLAGIQALGLSTSA